MLTRAHGKQILQCVFFYFSFCCLFIFYFFSGPANLHFLCQRQPYLCHLCIYTKRGKKEHICSTLTAATFPSNHPSLRDVVCVCVCVCVFFVCSKKKKCSQFHFVMLVAVEINHAVAVGFFNFILSCSGGKKKQKIKNGQMTFKRKINK